MIDELECRGERYIKQSQFTRLWKLHFDNVMLPHNVRIGVCANLKSMIKATRGDDAQKENSQAKERMKAMLRRDKALISPRQCMCLMIDGMDQKKTCLPHFTQLPKDIVTSVSY